MTAIRAFKVKNLAGREGVTHHELHPLTNIFWGLNGSGKTTLLKILDAALRNDSSGLENLPFQWAEVTIYSHRLECEIVRFYRKPPKNERNSLTYPVGATGSKRHLARSWEIDSEILEVTIDSAEKTQWESKISSGAADERSLKAVYRRAYLPISRQLELTGRERLMGTWEETADERFVDLVNGVWSKYRSRSLAQIRDVQQLGLAEVLGILFRGKPTEDQRETFSLDLEDERNPEDAFKVVSQFLLDQRIVLPLGLADFREKYQKSEEHRHVVTLIHRVMDKVEEILAPQHELQEVINEMYLGNKNLLMKSNRRLEVQINEESIPLSSLSSGERQLLHILLETLAIENSTIMVDEPELSLHPDWQLGLIGSMRRVNKEAQFLLASHSPELMVGIDDECVFEL